MPERSVTLLELIVVILIIGIIAAIALPNFGPMRERVLDKEATANLKLIQAAERVYRMETSFYYPYSGSETSIGTINTDLRLFLPAGATRNWDYEVKDTGCAQATRTVGTVRYWRFDIGEDEPLSGTCP